MTPPDLIRQMADLLLKTAELQELGDPIKTGLERLDAQFPRKLCLDARDMAAYWNVAENTARAKMRSQGFPCEWLGQEGKNGTPRVSKLALVVWELRHANEKLEIGLLPHIHIQPRGIKLNA